MKMNNVIIKDMYITKEYFEEYFKEHFEEEYTVRQNKIIQKEVDNYDMLECEYSSTTEEEYNKYCDKRICCLLKMRVNNYDWIYIPYNGSSFFALAMCYILPDDDDEDDEDDEEKNNDEDDDEDDEEMNNDEDDDEMNNDEDE